jgi:hypothetical protein
MPRRRRTGARVWFAGALALALLLGACGDDGDDASPTTTGGGELTASFRGVTADKIKLGILIVDYSCIPKAAIDFNRGNQQEIAQTFVDLINSEGGVGGRQLEPVYKTYCPIPPEGNPATQKICTELAEDDKVFVALGVFIDFSGDSLLCLTRDKEVIHVGHELQRAWIDEAPDGLLLTPDITQERRIEVLMKLIEEEGTLEGKKVAVVTSQSSEQVVDEVIKPALDNLGLEQGSTGILNITGTDTSAAQAQLDSFIERWKDEDIEALILSSQVVAGGKQFVEKIRAALPDVLFLTDVTAGTAQAAQSYKGTGQPNPYEGIISADGEAGTDRWERNPPKLKACRDAYEQKTGTEIVGPAEVAPGPDGQRVEIYQAVVDYCGELYMFKDIADKAGPNLTNESWTQAVNEFGTIDLVSAKIASLKEGKYDAEDGFRLIAFDSSIGNKGDWKGLTELIDTAQT